MPDAFTPSDPHHFDETSMIQGLPWKLLGALCAWWIGAHALAAEYKIVTASERGTYIQIGRDIARHVAPQARIDLEVLPSAGSAENVQRLRYEPGVKLAMVQSDVYQAFLDLAASGNAEADAMIRPLRVVMPLYNEEVYFIARADAPFDFVHEIKDAKINVGPLRSGTAMSATTLYRHMFGAPLPEANASFLSNEEALVKLTGDKTIDVVVVVAGQPAKLLVDMKPEARQLVKLLKFDPQHPASQAVLKTYFPATVRATNYPNLLAEDIPGVAVKAFLVTYDYKLHGTTSQLNRLARSLCANFGTLQSVGHPKWREVELGLPDLGQGWSYYPPTERALRACIAAQPKTKVAAQCTQQERILGLCR
jgi:TRAP transporter TAXI family solute receptor